MKKIYRTMLLVGIAGLLFPMAAGAEIRAKSYELGLYGGYNFFETGQNLKDRPLFGARLGYNFTEHFALEIGAERIRTRVDDPTITGVQEGQYRSPMDRVDLTFYHLNALYHFTPERRLTPFVLAGFGGAHYSPRIATGDMATINFGAGLKYAVNDKVAFRLDLRDYIVTEVFQESYHNAGVTMGLTYTFGGKRAAPEPVSRALTAPEPEAPVVVVLAEKPEVEQLTAVIVEEKVVVLALEDIHFDFDQATLTPEAQVILKRNIEVLQKNPKAQIRIAGYTSAAGTEEYNQRLSERRANTVRNYLIKEGIIAADRLSTVGYGQTRPAMHEATPQDLYSKAARSNMRVIFEIDFK
ncbi:OmpA family protein [Desulfurivibrio sp. C05AmB]|jgi:OmpA-OmpF porin, OOP family|uniref:OmpA family protein n=1 Tax=Desulfurivibrio sp. C05AmB TaxID=3374371 RepID=UPI00376ED174